MAETDDNTTTGKLPWQHMLDRSHELDLHAEQLFLVWSKPADGLAPIEEALAAHLTYQRHLDDTGVMFAAGPVATPEGTAWDGEGIFVYRAATMQDAQQIAQNDPMHKAGARYFEIRAWCLNEGTATRG